jgi:hypothetical protein
MSSAASETYSWPALRRRGLSVGAFTQTRFAFHAGGVAPALLLALWLTRRWFLSGALPAGTDMLGFVSRAAQNEGLSQALSLWDPASWGARRSLTIESLLGVLSSLTGDPVLTVKLFSLAVLATSGVTAYALAWRIRRSRLSAAIAGVLYLASQQSIAHWTSGHLNVEVGIALTPLLLLLWLDGVRAFSVSRSCALAVVAAAVVLARVDLLLYPIPFMALYVVVRLAISPAARDTLRNAAKTAGVAAIATIALSSYLLVPFAEGIRSRWITGSGLFNISMLVDRSVGAYQSMLGFAREIGYLSFTGQQTWTSHPWFPFAVYVASASIVVALAYGALALAREERTIYLAAVAVLATFMAKGLRPPLSDPFAWSVQHVPVFSNLRDPNRWIIPQALAYSVLAGITVTWLAGRLRSRAAGRVAAGAILSVALLPVAPTLLTGFRTVSVTPAQRQLLAAVPKEPQRSLVASVPYDQNYRFVRQAGYQGWEHDLGVESVAFTGHPTVGDGGWDQQASETVSFTAALLRHRDPAATSLLGTLGVKYLLDFSYPATAPDLLSGGANPLQQQHAVATLAGLESTASNHAGTLYRLPTYAPLLSFRPRIAVVLGGREGFAAFADAPGVDLRSWALFSADDVLAHQGLNGLLALIRSANEIVVADTTPNDLAVLASPPLASLTGITSSPDLAAQTHIITNDASTRLGSLASETAAPAQSGRRAAATTFRLDRTQTTELWARVRSGPSAARLSFSVDGTPVGSVTPVTAIGGGFRWYRIARANLLAGAHRLAVRASASPFGNTYELDEAKVISPETRDGLRSTFARQLRAHADHVLYSYTPAEIQPPLALGELRHPVAPTSTSPQRFWQVVDPTRVHESNTKRGLLLSLIPPRRYHTFVEHFFDRPLDWSAVDHIYFRLGVTGATKSYRFVVDFNRRYKNSASFVFDARGTRSSTYVFAPTGLGSGDPERWSHVTSIRIATDDRSGAALVGLGGVRVSMSRSRTLRLPVTPSSQRRTAIVGNRRSIPPHADALTVRLSPRFLVSNARVLVLPAKPAVAIRAPRVSFERNGATGYRFAVHSRSPGVLVFNQAYDPRWELDTSGSRTSSISAFGLVNGYLLPAGTYTGSIGFRGDAAEELGAGISGGSLLVLVALGLGTGRKRRWWQR